MNTPKKLKIPIEKQQEFIAEFEKIRPHYIEFAQLIDTILNNAVGSLSILGIVQARAKGVVSFANKIISKDKYQSPLVDMTELQPWRTFSIFISSTFADMQAERDYLKQIVFPRVEEELQKRRIKLEFVDLRWGVDITSM